MCLVIILILSSKGVCSVYNFLPSLVSPSLTKISIIASGAIDSVTKGSIDLLNASEIPFTNPLDNCSSVSIPSCTFRSILLNGVSK